MSEGYVLTREDRERLVLISYRQGKTRREIAKIARMSFTDIATIINREFGSKEENKKGKNMELSIYAQALKLFLKGEKQVSVAITLNLSYEETRRIYLQFLNLNRMHKLNQIYHMLGDKIEPFLSMYNRMVENDLRPKQVANAVKFANELPQLENTCTILKNEIHALDSQKQNLNSELNTIGSDVEHSKDALQYYNNEIKMNTDELSALDNQIITKKKFIQNFDNEEGYIRIKKAATEQTNFVIQDNRALLAVTIYATLEAIRRYPDSQALIFDLLTSQGYSTISNKQSWVDSHGPPLLQLTEHILAEIAEQITNVTMSNIRARNDESQI